MTLDKRAVPDYHTLWRLDDKVVVVLGAGQGIGRQTAHALAQAGAHVYCVGRREGPTTHVANEVGGTPFVGDAQERSDVERLFTSIDERFGRLDGIVDIIAQGIKCSAMSVTKQQWDWQYDNVIGHALLTTQVGGPLLVRTGEGAITFVSSTAGHTVFEGLDGVGYGTAKAALEQLTRVAAVELGPSGVRVNAVSPALVRTPRYDETQTEAWFSEAKAIYPLRRVADPADIASSILFLTSSWARQVTGQILHVDGGLSVLTPAPYPKTGVGPAELAVSEEGSLKPQTLTTGVTP